MKRFPLYLLLLCTVFSLVLSACARKDGFSISDMPQTLHLTAELPEGYPSEVTSYEVDWYSVDEQSAVDAFMDHEPQERLEWNVGPQYVYEDEEFLNIYSGVVKGGFRYGSHMTDSNYFLNELLRKKQPWEFVSGDSFPLIMNNEIMEEAVPEDLDFMPYDEALADIESRLDACGFPEHELYIGEAHTLSLFNKNKDIYNRAAKELGKDKLTDTFTKEQEYYYFVFRQTQDGIPFCNAIWTQAPYVTGGPTEIDAVYTRHGVEDFNAVRACVTGDAISTEAIISPEEALGVYVEEYSKAIHFSDTEIISIELNYIMNTDSKGIYARPAWIILTGEEPVPGEERECTEYEITTISAYSGVILERETDMR